MGDRDEIRRERHKDRQRDRNLARAAPDKRLKLCLGNYFCYQVLENLHAIKVDIETLLLRSILIFIERVSWFALG